jgi:pimeloyl-ACP methyl ester carboxylesterase
VGDVGSDATPGTAAEATTGLRSSLNVRIEGTGRDLVMLHGGGGGIDDLAELRGLLASDRRVISPDQRGHGSSPGGPEISYAAQARETAELLDELHVKAADIVGWSDGGIVGLLLARDRPDLVHRLVAISANAALESNPPALTDKSREFLAGMKSDVLEMPAGRASVPGAAEEWPATAAQLLAMWRAGPDLPIADLGGIRAPVLYLAADGDIVPTEHTLAMQRATPGAQLAIIPDANHRLPQQRAPEVAAIVERFLGS